MYRSRDNSSRKFVSAVAVAAMAFAWNSAALAQDANTLRYATITEPPGLSLHEKASGATFVPLQALYEPLLRLGADMSLKPLLAESWEQIGLKTYVFKMRAGVKFHSGNPFTALDVKKSFDLHMDRNNPGFASDYLEPVESITVKDPLTLEIKLKRPYGPFIYALSVPHTAIGDMKKYEEVGADGLRNDPSGTGPYMLDTWSKGAELVLKSNPNYWGGKPSIDRIKFRFIPEPVARSIGLETGEVDLVESLASPDIARLVANPDITVTDLYELRSVKWLFNMRDDVLKDVAVRRAIAHAIDYDLAINSVLGEAGRPMHGYVPKGSFGYTRVVYGHDPAKATRLLEGAGWKKGSSGFFEKNGKRLTWTHVSGAHLAQEVEVAEAIQTLLREFGIDLKLEVLDRVVHTSRMWANAKTGKTAGGTPPDFGTTQWDWGIRTVDASATLDPTFTCGGDRNFGHYCNPDYDKLIAAAVSGIPAKERIAKFKEAQKILFDIVPALPLYQPRITVAYRNRVQNVRPTPTRIIYFSDLSLKR